MLKKKILRGFQVATRRRVGMANPKKDRGGPKKECKGSAPVDSGVRRPAEMPSSRCVLTDTTPALTQTLTLRPRRSRKRWCLRACSRSSSGSGPPSSASHVSSSPSLWRRSFFRSRQDAPTFVGDASPSHLTGGAPSSPSSQPFLVRPRGAGENALKLVPLKLAACGAGTRRPACPAVDATSTLSLPAPNLGNWAAESPFMMRQPKLYEMLNATGAGLMAPSECFLWGSPWTRQREEFAAHV